MIKPEVKTFENIVGKKPPREYEEALRTGFFEAYRYPIPGGHSITIAHRINAVVPGPAGDRPIRKTLLLLDEMPPNEVINKNVQIQSREFVIGNSSERIKGSYGMADGRLFLVVGDGHGSKEEPEKDNEELESIDAATKPVRGRPRKIVP